MSQEIKNVLIIGAGGNVGPYIFSALDSDAAFTVSVLSREGSTSKFPSHTTVHQIPNSYPEDVLLKAFKGQDAIIDLAPLDSSDQHKRCIDVAIKAGVKRFIPGEFGSDTELPEVRAAVPVFKGKTDLQEYLVSKEGDGLTWTGIINGPFFDWGLETGFIGFNLQQHTAVIYDSGNNYADMTLLSTVGKAVVGVLKNPKETANRYIRINSFRVTQNQILAALEKATGTQWEVFKASCEEQRKKGKELLAKGDRAGFGPLLLALEYSGADYLDFEKYGLWNDKLGLPKANVGLEEAIKKVVQEGHVSQGSKYS